MQPMFIDFTLSSLLFKKWCVDRHNAVLPFPDSFDILDIGNTCLSCPAFLFPLHFLGCFHKPADSSDQLLFCLFLSDTLIHSVYGTETEIYAGESFYFYPTLVFYEGTKKEFGALLTDEIPEENVDIHKIPAGTYVVGYHKGAYEQIQDSFKRIREWGQNLDLEDGILAVNIIDQFVEQNNENYATRIEVRITDTH